MTLQKESHGCLVNTSSGQLIGNFLSHPQDDSSPEVNGCPVIAFQAQFLICCRLGRAFKYPLITYGRYLTRDRNACRLGLRPPLVVLNGA